MATALQVPPVAAQLGRSKEMLLDATARLLRDQGHGATTMRTIAAAAGMQAGSVYSHFRSKDELVQIVLDRGILRVHAAVREALAATEGEDPATRLEAAIIAHLRGLFAQSDYTYASIKTFGSATDAVREANARLRDAYEREWVRLIADWLGESASQPGDYARSLRLLLLGGMNAVIDWYRPDGPMSLEELGRHFAEALSGKRPASVGS